MKTIEILFGNLFNRTQILTFRLVAFARFTLAYLITSNRPPLNDDYIAKLTDALTAVEAEVEEVDLALATQLSKTGTLIDVIESFENTMSTVYVDIAYLTREQPEVLALFYPRGRTEYNRITRAEAPVLMARVHELAQEHAVLLKPDLVTRLSGFEATFDAVREAQLAHMSRVSTNRSERNTARPNLELVLTELIHEIARRHPGDINACKAYVRWNLLYAPSARRTREQADNGDESVE